MKTPSAAGRVGASSDDDELLADLFHALNQPIAALQCSLEVTLQSERTEEQYREVVKAALDQVQNITQLTGGISRLWQAEDGGGPHPPLAFDTTVRQVVEEWLPMASEAQQTISLTCGFGGEVRTGSRQFRQALFQLLEYALTSSPRGAELGVETRQRQGNAELILTWQPQAGSRKESDAGHRESEKRALQLRLSLAVSRRMFEAAGGRGWMEEMGGRQRAHFSLPVFREGK